MTTRYPMKCRFGGEACGTFSNAIRLRQHYDAAHPNDWPPKPKRSKALVPVVTKAPALPPLGLDDLDVVVLGVVEQIAKAVPIELLPAVFAWREATARFLHEVDVARSR